MLNDTRISIQNWRSSGCDMTTSSVNVCSEIAMLFLGETAFFMIRSERTELRSALPLMVPSTGNKDLSSRTPRETLLPPNITQVSQVTDTHRYYHPWNSLFSAEDLCRYT
ncbi:hypothetical protein E2C01_053811 [Portunus trituberculatus]|uniref:Uncharacterized protein n=1 Tax=Portunus trituberculatus TaxID=210409 RepID=A0A5B7GQB2_PORTR|nr:hypothetical protein [Portunus trituberculatus]